MLFEFPRKVRELLGFLRLQRLPYPKGGGWLPLGYDTVFPFPKVLGLLCPKFPPQGLYKALEGKLFWGRSKIKD